MGHSSLPMLNKAGTTIRWPSIWDDKHFYNIKFEEDIFLKIFFDLILREPVFLYCYYFKKNFLINLRNLLISNNFLTFHKFKNFYLLRIFKLNNHPFLFYFMRFYILRVKNIHIIFLNLFFPIAFKLKKKSFKKKKKNN